MRLIDLDALMQFPIRWNHYDEVNGSEEYISGVETVLEYAENLPTVDAEPVRHGRWESIKRPGTSLWCSECKAPSPWAAYHNFCPNCGAEMKKPEVKD